MELFFELTHEQVEDSKKTANELAAKNSSSGSGEQAASVHVKQMLLPFQQNLLNERSVWREVEIYGFAPCIVSGRLGKILQVSSRQRERLKAIAPEVVREIDRFLRRFHERRLEVIRENMAKSGYQELFFELFGGNSEKVTFRL